MTGFLTGIARRSSAARVASDQSGVVLVTTLIVVGTLTIMVSGLSMMVSSGERAHGRDRRELRAFNAAETGVSLAAARLSTITSSSYAAGSSIGPTSFTVDGNATGGSWTAVKGTTQGAATTWAITSTATVGDATRRVKARIAAPQATMSTPASPVWGYGFFVADPSGCTSMTGTNQLTLSVFVAGNLCLSGTQNIREPVAGLPTAQKKVTVYAGGYIQTGGSASIGASGAANTIKAVTAVGGCKKSNGAAVICSNSSQSKVYADSYTSAPATLTKPPIDPDGQYAAGAWTSPVCSTGTIAFDNNTTRDTSLGSINLFTAQAYDCAVFSDAGHTNQVGRISWNPTTHQLAVSGTLYFDGNLNLAGGAQASYTGFATLYVDGTVTTNGNSALCGPGATLNGSHCDGLWDGHQGALAIVAVNHQSVEPTWQMNGTAEYNVLAYIVGTFVETGTAKVTGPVITDRATVAGTADQTDVTDPPPGTPGAAGTSTTSSWGGIVAGSWQQCPLTTSC